MNEISIEEIQLIGEIETRTHKFNSFYLNRFYEQSTNKYLLTDNIELIEDEVNHSQIYRHTYKVYHHSKIIGYIFTDPTLNTDIIQFKFDNKLFYDGTEIKSIIELLERVFFVSFTSISEIHIALDIAGKEVLNKAFEIERYSSSNNYFTHIQKSDLPEIEKENKLSEIKYRPILKRKPPFRTISDTQLLIGNIKKPVKSISIYDKEQMLKPYQSKYFHSYLGTTAVTRIELKVKREHLKERPISIDNLNDKKILSSYFFNEVKVWLTFHTNNYTYDEHRNKVYEKISLIEGVNINPTPFQPLPPTEIEQTEIRKENYSKRYLKSLMKDHLLNNADNKKMIIRCIDEMNITKEGANKPILKEMEQQENISVALSILKDIAAKNELPDLSNYDQLMIEISSHINETICFN